jgi:hypothetical protein
VNRDVFKTAQRVSDLEEGLSPRDIGQELGGK